jgi:4-hydroxy-2-oxoheptanedioate aldolase
MAGWDFLIFDAEHGSLDPSDFQNLARACERRGMAALVRTPGREPHMINRFLDGGAKGVMAPLVNDRAAAAQLVQAVKYPPLGSRGLAPARAADFGLGVPLPSIVENANAQTVTIVQIETAAAVDRIGEILAEPHVDVVFIGPADLSTSLGHCMNLSHPVVAGAIQKVAQAVAGSDKHLGILIARPEHMAMALGMGARFIVCYMDSILLNGCRAFLEVRSGTAADG